MEHLNRIELKGTVGSVQVRTVREESVTLLTVATNYVYKAIDGSHVIETTWHNVTAWKDAETEDAENLKKGDEVHILGRIRQQKYVATSGEERSSYNVLASYVKRIPKENKSDSEK